MDKLSATFACVAFIAKVIVNIIYLDDASKSFMYYDTELSPADSPLLICRASLSYCYTSVFIFYCTVKTLQKHTVPNIITSRFYAAFSVSCIFEALYIAMWAQGFAVVGFLLICAASIVQYLALYCAFTALYNATNRDSEVQTSTIWCNRVLVQSGLIFDCAWNSVLVIINLAVVLCYRIGLTSLQSSVIGLLVFAIGLLLWFGIENLIFEKYVRFTVAEYIAISIAMTSLLSRSRTGESYFPIMLLSCMTLVLVLLFSRVTIIMCMESRRKNQEQLYTIVTI